MREDFFNVTPDFFSLIEQIIKTQDSLVLRKEQAKFVTDFGFVAKTSLSNQQQLAAWLCENSLHLNKLPERKRPLLVVTANKLPDKLVGAGAWRVMSNLAESDTWKALQTEPPVDASATVKKATSSHSISTPSRVSRTVKQEFEKAESASESANDSSRSESDSFQCARTERKIPSLKEWGEQLVTHLSLLPSVISNSVPGAPKDHRKDSDSS